MISRPASPWRSGSSRRWRRRCPRAPPLGTALRMDHHDGPGWRALAASMCSGRIRAWVGQNPFQVMNSRRSFGHEGGEILVGDEDDLLGVLEDLLDHPDCVAEYSRDRTPPSPRPTCSVAEDLRPGCSAFRVRAARGDHVAIGQPAFLSAGGRLLGERIFAVSAMKCTRRRRSPPRRLGRLDAQLQRVADEIGDVLDLGSGNYGKDDRLASFCSFLILSISHKYLLDNPSAQDVASSYRTTTGRGDGLLRSENR